MTDKKASVAFYCLLDRSQHIFQFYEGKLNSQYIGRINHHVFPLMYNSTCKILVTQPQNPPAFTVFDSLNFNTPQNQTSRR